jgi:hypothetical protein
MTRKLISLAAIAQERRARVVSRDDYRELMTAIKPNRKFPYTLFFSSDYWPRFNHFSVEFKETFFAAAFSNSRKVREKKIPHTSRLDAVARWKFTERMKKKIHKNSIRKK